MDVLLCVEPAVAAAERALLLVVLAGVIGLGRAVMRVALSLVVVLLLARG